jgi:hypothetical protein
MFDLKTFKRDPEVFVPYTGSSVAVPLAQYQDGRLVLIGDGGEVKIFDGDGKLAGDMGIRSS